MIWTYAGLAVLFGTLAIGAGVCGMIKLGQAAVRKSVPLMHEAVAWAVLTGICAAVCVFFSRSAG